MTTYLSAWLLGGLSECRRRQVIYEEMVLFLKRKGVIRQQIPHPLFEMMQAYLQEGVPFYYQDPQRRFILWVGAGQPTPDSFLFYRE